MKALSNFADCPNCGSGHKSRPLCLFANGWYCFSCGYTKVSDRGYTPVHNGRVVITDWPDAEWCFEAFSLDAQIWLTQYGITAELAQFYNIHYIDNCLLFPVFDDSQNLVCYQKRNIKERAITTYGQKLPHLLKSLVVIDTLVVVEDYISAIKVHTSGYSALCLWGTSLSTQELNIQFKNYNHIIVWLDNDAAKEINSGQIGANKIIVMGNKILNKCYGFSFGTKTIHNIATDKDPKCYNTTKINDLIQGVLHNE